MGKEEKAIKEAAAAIKRHRSAVILCHQHPDGDALGSILGMGLMLSRAGHSVQASWPEPFELPGKYMFLPGNELIAKPEDIKFDGIVIALDCANVDRLEDISGSVLEAPDLLNIDHHPDNTRFGSVNIVAPGAAATAEIIYLAAGPMGLNVDEDVAQCLFTGIVTDTGRFQFSNTSSETLRIASEMVSMGVEPHIIYENVYQSDSLPYLRLYGEMLTNAVFEEDLSLIHGAVMQADLKRWGVRMAETEDLIDGLRTLKGHRIAVLFKETRDGRIRVSLRSRADIDIGGIARRLGGGGHRAAAGYTSTRRSVREALAELREEILASGWHPGG